MRKYCCLLPLSEAEGTRNAYYKGKRRKFSAIQQEKKKKGHQNILKEMKKRKRTDWDGRKNHLKKAEKAGLAL